MNKPSAIQLYLRTALILMGLLVVTVAVAYINLGSYSTPVAMLISVIKATLIILVFMHVRHAAPLITVVMLAGFFWLAILLGLTLSDYLTRHVIPF